MKNQEDNNKNNKGDNKDNNKNNKGYNKDNNKNNKRDNNMKNNFLLVSLEESKAKKLAEVISNDTARKILDHLAKQDATESEISKELNIPISTVHYNLKQLQDANLVTVEEFHYSQKGKEVNHYKLANKYIIIAPKSEDNKFIEALKKIIPLTVITASVTFSLKLLNMATTASGGASGSQALMSAKSEVADQAVYTGTRLMAASAPQSLTLEPTLSVGWYATGIVLILGIYLIYLWKKD
jgi:DNA-binding transcriptional ArsR family regulator